MKSNRILIVLTDLHGNGGIQRFNRNLIAALDTPRYTLDILTLNDPSGEGYTGCDRKKILFLIRFIFSILSWPDKVIVGHINFNPLCLITKMFRIKSCVILHGVDAWKPKKISRYFFRYPNEYWSVSAYTTRIFLETSALPNFKVQSIFNTLPSNWNINDNQISYDKWMLTVTRLDTNDGYKGVDKTILAINEIKDDLQELGWKYHLVCAGDDLIRHKNLVKDLKLDSLVIFHSTLSDDELMDLYRTCSFFILPSTGEGFGIVFLEAMIYHKPCIGAHNCGTEDVIENRNTGFLIDQNVAEIKEHIRILLNNPNLCKELGKNGYNKYKHQFTFEKFSETIHSLLSKV